MPTQGNAVEVGCAAEKRLAFHNNSAINNLCLDLTADSLTATSGNALVDWVNSAAQNHAAKIQADIVVSEYPDDVELGELEKIKEHLASVGMTPEKARLRQAAL